MAAAKETKVVRGVELRRDPAREKCFEIVHLHHDVPESGNVTLEARRQRAHREYNQEVQTLEIAALCLVDYPEAPWELRMELARQCWDEARHAAMAFAHLKELGGWKGMYAIANLDWATVAMLDSLPARLAIQHRTFEAGSLDSENAAVPMLKEMGHHEQAEMMDAIEADEIQHVRFGNDWLKRLTAAQPRALLEVASAVNWLRKVVEATGGDRLKEIATSSQTRELAGFSRAEITEVDSMARVALGSPAPGPGPSHHG